MVVAGSDSEGHRQGRSAVYDGRTMLELLPPAECWRLLREHQLGRVGLVAAGEPLILPVNYAVLERSIVFRTADGTKLHALSSWPVVAFEIDGAEDDRGGWSVVVTGRGEQLHHPKDVRAAEALGLQSWAPGAKLNWVRIAPHRVSGRRLPRGGR